MQTSQKENWWLVAAVILLVITPLIFVRGEYGGADGEATEAIAEIQPNYQPWFNPVLELPSGEIETLLFVFQGAIAAGTLGYIIGLYKGRTEKANQKANQKD
jgi:cobalt/nickel transport protein